MCNSALGRPAMKVSRLVMGRGIRSLFPSPQVRESVRPEPLAPGLDLEAIMGLDLAVYIFAGRGSFAQRPVHVHRHVEIAVAVAARIPEVERARLVLIGCAVDGTRLELEDVERHQSPTSSRLSRVALPPALVVSVLVTRSAQ